MLQNYWIHHNLWNKQSDTPILRQSAFPIHGKADTRQSLWIISYMLGTKEALTLVSRSTTTREILFKFQQSKKKKNKKNKKGFWVWLETRLPSKLKSAPILRYCTGKASSCSLPCDNVNQLEVEEAISLGTSELGNIEIHFQYQLAHFN